MTKRGRPPKPTHLKLVTGNPGKRPIPDDWVKPSKLDKAPPPPKHLDAYAAAEWRRLAKELATLGTLTNLDRGPFAAYCQAWSIYLHAQEAIDDMARKDDTGMGAMLMRTKAGNVIQNPLIGIRNQAMKNMVRYAAEFGFTPSSRVRVQDGAPAGARQNREAGENFFD